jgi:hypothetical protein
VIGIGLDESPPAIVEKRVGEIDDLVNLTTPKGGIHTPQHVDRILARESAITFGSKPIVKAIGNRPQQW